MADFFADNITRMDRPPGISAVHGLAGTGRLYTGMAGFESLPLIAGLRIRRAHVKNERRGFHLHPDH